MAYPHHHNNNNHHSTATPCCCHPQPSPPPPPPPPYDPLLISTVISHLLQTQPPQNQTHCFPHPTHFHPNPNPFLSSLIHRIDNLEASFSRLSSGLYPKDYLKDAAARVIQTRFRVFLVRRSRTLRDIKELGSIKSVFNCLKSGSFVSSFVDYDYVLRKSMDLLNVVDSIQGEDKMIRDSKKSITREIEQFLEMIDRVCVKKHQMMSRKITRVKLVSDDRGFLKRGEGSKGRNEEKKVMAKLRERVERIGKMSRELEELEEEEKEEDVTEDDSESSENLADDNHGNFNHFRSKDAPNNRATINNKSVAHGRGSKEDEGKRMMGKLRERVERIGKMSRALEAADDETYRFSHKNGKMSRALKDGNKMIDVEEIEDSTKARQDEEEHEDESDEEERSTKSSEDAGNTSRS